AKDRVKPDVMSIVTHVKIEQVDYLDPGRVADVKPSRKLWRCNIDGCTYQTRRRADLRRHRRTNRHRDNDPSDSESDTDSPPWECKLCQYVTAKRFSFERHERSLRHRRNQLYFLESEPPERPDDAEDPSALPMERPCSEEPPPEELSSEDHDDCSLFICTVCDFSTSRKLEFRKHNRSLEHLESLRMADLERWMIEYAPQDEPEEEFAEEARVTIEVEEDLIPENCSTFECRKCDYRTARRHCFLRHIQSRKHRSRLREDTAESVSGELLTSEELGFDVIEYDPQGQELPEIVCLPSQVNPEGNSYHIVMDSA
ncbi:hypothetical protein KR018_006277, partial [Drosophila ironensis]